FDFENYGHRVAAFMGVKTSPFFCRLETQLTLQIQGLALILIGRLSIRICSIYGPAGGWP
ncbi:MAG: hypothetical protein ACRD40_08245, partial [Candidatus Acidiferrales bacterium]